MERQDFIVPPKGILKWILPALAVGIIVALFQLTQHLGPELYGYFADTTYVVVPGTLVAFSIILSMFMLKRKHPETRPIVFFTIGFSCIFLGEQLWTIYKEFLGEEPFPSLADFFYLSFYPFFSLFFLHYLKPSHILFYPIS